MSECETTARVRRQLLLARVPQTGYWRLEEGGGILGRGDDADIQIDDSSVSRYHCRFADTAHGWLVEDLATTNGTRVNGVPVLRAYLTSGDWLEVGTARLRVNVVEAPGRSLLEALTVLWQTRQPLSLPHRRAA
ncbi:MAG: FHA domain-containing protein [Planctomycetes bacterium]|jgi:predicted component of type VI protein secretion system|nr:FHA domain-containing protein [Planctomycetota bacterium]